MKRVLIACEYSGRVREALRKKGVDAWSCDILPSDDNSDYHIQKDLKEVLKDEWFGIIAFPPCTHLAVSGARHFHKKQKEQKEALKFVQMIFDYDCEYLCIENPVSVISSKIKKPTQYIQPWEHGHPVSKKTGLWLKGLPKLESSKIVQPEYITLKDGKRYSKWYYKTSCLPQKERSKARSKTFTGIASAIADQWHKYLI